MTKQEEFNKAIKDNNYQIAEVILKEHNVNPAYNVNWAIQHAASYG